ncbi:UDP-3-O-(3-hydroxymyristoyl)glucosamine N-acyltransferase [Saliniradius amylolyticus]|uniref:UDP-3-O-acylglucosamine N-acyltransferase n=2 Tax=Saliniradius amylolyticus TaxID=2183582 RepID=A0A2S2E503_9ALTE|nr:UDP-3-O-(3-hydroxymyristoyl)glucosamine N-acyltransferase [Saliniradius amylolyticus]
MESYTLARLAEHIGAQVHGDGSVTVESLATLQDAVKGQISFLANSKYASQLCDTQASAVIVQAEHLSECPCSALVMDNPYVGFALAAQLMDTTPVAAKDISSKAVVADDVVLGEGVSIGPGAVVESGAQLAAGVQIGPNCFVGKDVHIGEGTKLWANVTLYHGCRIGADCLFQSGAVIGSDGFGYANDRGNWIKIPQLGRVIIGDRVEIGANSCIDRGALGDTIIHDGVIIDNLCQIAHNVELGANVAIAGCSVIAGSTTIGANCTMGGQTGIAGHLEIGDNVHFTGKSMVTKSISEPGLYSSGLPVQPNREWRKSIANLRNLGKLSQRVKTLEKQAKGE